MPLRVLLDPHLELRMSRMWLWKMRLLYYYAGSGSPSYITSTIAVLFRRKEFLHGILGGVAAEETIHDLLECQAL